MNMAILNQFDYSTSSLLLGIILGLCLSIAVINVGSSRKTIQSTGREIICNVHAYLKLECENEGILLDPKSIGENRSSRRTVINILQEKEMVNK